MLFCTHRIHIFRETNKTLFVLTELHCDIQAMRLCMHLCDLQGYFFEPKKNLSLRPQNALILRRQNCFQIGSLGPVTPKFAPSGFQNESQSNTKSIKYPSLIHTKTDSEFGLLMTFPFHLISLDLIAQMPFKCVKF